MLNRPLALTALCAVLLAPGLAAAQGEVNVYTYREQKLIAAAARCLHQGHRIKVNVISASSGLEQRIKTEGANSPADLLLTVDIARLQDARRSASRSRSSRRWSTRRSPQAIPRSERPLGTASRCARASSTPRRSA